MEPLLTADGGEVDLLFGLGGAGSPPVNFAAEGVEDVFVVEV